ncbi:hypothetical protein D3C76_1863380 [compost metagenome]
MGSWAGCCRSFVYQGEFGGSPHENRYASQGPYQASLKGAIWWEATQGWLANHWAACSLSDSVSVPPANWQR